MLASQLGATLLRRTTRRVSLTAQGREYFNQCRDRSACCKRPNACSRRRRSSRGRTAAPLGAGLLGPATVPRILSAFLKAAQPRIRVDLFTNMFLDLIAENVDVANRFGELRDERGPLPRSVCRGDAVLKERPLPTTADLAQHDCGDAAREEQRSDWDSSAVAGKRACALRDRSRVAISAQ